MKKETKQVLDDLKARGIDVSSIERQITNDPLAEKAADNIIGGGILRQQNYSRFMNETQERDRKVQETAQRLATLHDAKGQVTLPQETLDTIEVMEKALIETGMFTEESVKELSYHGKKPLIEAREEDDKDKGKQPNNDRRISVANENLDLSKYVDEETHRASLANIAFGSIATNLQINAGMEELKQLGIPITREKVKQFEEKLRDNFSRGDGNLDKILDEVFEVSKAKAAKDQINYDAKVKEEVSKQVAEALKENGATNRVGRLVRRSSPVFGRNRPAFVDSSKTTENGNGYKDDKGNIDVSKLPKNKEGDPLLFTARGDRDSRVNKATESFIEIEQKISEDPLYDY